MVNDPLASLCTSQDATVGLNQMGVFFDDIYIGSTQWLYTGRTVEASFYCSNAPADAAQQGIAHFTSVFGSTSFGLFYAYLVGEAGQTKVKVQVFSKSGQAITLDVGVINTNEWYHLVIRTDSSPSNSVKAYLGSHAVDEDGLAIPGQSPDDFPGDYTATSSASLGSGSGNDQIKVFAFFDLPGSVRCVSKLGGIVNLIWEHTAFHLDGGLAEFRVSSGRISDADINTNNREFITNATSGYSTLAHCWRLNEATAIAGSDIVNYGTNTGVFDISNSASFGHPSHPWAVVPPGVVYTADESDAISATDATIRKTRSERSDSVTTADALTAKIDVDLSDSITASDTDVRKVKPSRSDSISATDAIVIEDGAARSDTIAPSETIGTKTNVSVSDAITAADAVEEKASVGLSDSFSASDSYILKITVTPSDSISLSDSATAPGVDAAVLSDSLTSSDSITAKTSVQPTDSISIADAATSGVAEEVSDSLTISDSSSAKYVLSVSDSISASEAISFAVSESVVDTISTSDTIGAKTNVTVSDSVSTSDATVIPITFAVSPLDSISLADTLSSAASYTTSVSDTIVSADAEDAINPLYEPTDVVHVQAQMPTSDAATLDFAGVDNCVGAIFVFAAATSLGTAAAHARYGVGFYDGTEQFSVTFCDRDSLTTSTDNYKAMSNSKCVYLYDSDASHTVDVEATASILASGTGVRLTFSNAPATAYYISAILFGGDIQVATGYNVTNAVVDTLDSDTTVGFKPDNLMLASTFTADWNVEGTHGILSLGMADNSSEDVITQMCEAYAVGDNQTTSRSADAYRSTRALTNTHAWAAGATEVAVEINAMLSNGFNYYTRDKSDSRRFIWFAIKWGTGSGHTLKSWTAPTAAAPTTQNVALSHAGDFGILMMNRATAETYGQNALASFGMGIYDQLTEASYWTGSQHSVSNPTAKNTNSLADSKVINLPEQDATDGYEADYGGATSLGEDFDYTVNVEQVAYTFWGLFIEKVAINTAVPISKGDVLVTSDAVAAKTVISISDAIVTADTAGTVASVSVSDSVTTADSTQTVTRSSLTDTISASDSRVISLRLTESDSISISDVASPAVSISVSDSIVISDSMTISDLQAVSDTIVVTDSISRVISASPTDVISITDIVETPSGDLISVADTVTVVIRVTPSDAIAGTEVVEALLRQAPAPVPVVYSAIELNALSRTMSISGESLNTVSIVGSPVIKAGVAV